MRSVSVIIPVYNAEQYIGECINSVLQQTWRNVQLIIVNDGSTDKTADVARSFLPDERIKYIETTNHGCSSAKNTGLQLADGDFIQYLDADDILSADKIECQVAAIKDSETGLAVCRTKTFKNDPQSEQGEEIDTNFLYSTTDTLSFLLNLYGENGRVGMIQPNAFLMTKKLTRQIGPWDLSLSPSPDEDGEYFCRAILASESLFYTAQPVNYYRVGNKGSLSKKYSHLHARGALASLLLKGEHLLQREDSIRVRKVISMHLSAYIYQYFDFYPDLIKQADQELKKLGFHHYPVTGGRNFRLLAGVLGMKTTLRLRSKGIKLLKIRN